jgi:hypothetical protein
MSEQGDGGYGDGSYSDGGYGAGATGADAFAGDEGVDPHYLGAPQGDDLDRIHARMDKMTAQQQAIVEALQTGYGDDYEDDDYDYDEDGEQPTVEELAAQYGVSPEELLALSEQGEQGEQPKAVVGDRAVGREQPAGIPRLQLESAQGAEQRTPPPPDSEYWGDKIVQAAQRLRPQI